MKRFALAWCLERDLPVLKHGLLHTFAAGQDAQWDVLEATDESFLRRAHGYDGYVIGGSLRSVVDDAGSAVVSNVLNLIGSLQAARTNVPVVGVCFGAQALAVALGGKVGPNPGGGFRLGVESLDWTPQAHASRWPETTQPATVVASHGECVLELPPHSVALASSQTAPHEVFVVQERFLGIQGHPEVDADLLQRVFMALHRPLFDAAEWPAIEAESTLPVQREPLVELGRRLLSEGRL